MAMGKFQLNRAYRQEDPMKNANAMAMLQKMKSNEYSKIGEAVDQQGQSMARGKVAELMGQDGFDKLNPAQAQALVLEATGGRDMGDRGKSMLKELYGQKSDVQGNTWKQDAATLADTRANNRQAQGFANSKSLANINNSARQKLYGDEVSGKLTGKQFAEMNSEIKALENGIKEQTDPIAKVAMQERIDELKFNRTKGMKKNTSSYMAEDLLGIKKNSGTRSGRNKTPKWGGKKYSSTHPDVRNFINSKYGSQVTEGKDGYYFRGQKLTPEYLKTLGG